MEATASPCGHLDAFLPDLLLTPDTFPDDRYDKKHVVDLISEFGGSERVPLILTQIVADELSKYGVEYEASNRSSRSKTRKSPRRNKEPVNGIHRLTEVRLGSCDTKIHIPFIIKETCDFIRKHIQDEGILRKSGSSSRAACIMQRFLSPENDDYFSTFDTVHDVANVLKQYLRGLEVPLIPYSIHNIFLQCLQLSSKKSKEECILLSTCIIPSQTIGVLSYVIEFLAEVAQLSGDNLMTSENLAIVMGPNIMPVDQRKHEKGKEIQQVDRYILDQHNKIVEILIINAESVGRVNAEVEKRLETFISLRSSEDELENDGGGRRKKRRSGSLNRMLGFLKKVTSSKGGETPIIPSTPCGDSFSHTPIIKGSTKKKTLEDNIFSMYKKKYLLDGVRKNGLHFNDMKSDVCSTPNTLAALIACPSPAVCLDPSPMRTDWKQTPNGNRLKNFVTPSLLRRRDKCGDSEKNVFSAPAKASKPRLRFGKKAVKKQEDSKNNETQRLLQKNLRTSSAISIHNLVSSPRATLQRNPSSRIPRPDKPVVPPRKSMSSGDMSIGTPDLDFMTPDNDDNSGDYVCISAMAELTDDVKNEAFIASSISLTESEYEPLNFCKNSKDASSTFLTEESSLIEHPPKIEFMQISDSSTLDFSSEMPLQLTPLIKEIDNLTRTAEQLTLSTLKGKSTSSLKGIRTLTLPESPTELDTTPLNVEQVENKFIRTLKETKITKIKSESGSKRISTNIHRRLSVQDRGVSPSQRRILSSARRRSHEISRVTPAVSSSTHISSIRIPRNSELSQISINASYGNLRRSPTTRCTLKRGRPNTTRVGLARPSPVRTNTPRSCNRSKAETAQKLDHQESSVATPMRRMSSVQELVKKLERDRNEKSIREQSNTLSTLPDIVPVVKIQVSEGVATRSKSKSKLQSDKVVEMETNHVDKTSSNEDQWVAAHKFRFERKDLRGLKNSERDSIHFLKTLHAGKVPATVEFFNKIGKPTIKSPGRSLIPRYTALHRSDSSRSNLNSNVSTPEGNAMNPIGSKNHVSTDKLSRRISSIDIREKHEQLLENIKKERSIKRSATTAASYQANLNRNSQLDKRDGGRMGNIPARRPITLALSSNVTPARTISTRVSFRRTPTAQTPKITEEDESFTACVQNAIDTLLGKKSPAKFSKHCSPVTASPLKSSNIANIHCHPSMKGTPPKKPQFESPKDETKTMIRTISERGTKSSTGTTPKMTPKIKKALTTRAYDMINKPTPRSAAHKCPTITPMRRYPLRFPNENRNLTPLKASHAQQ